MFRQSSVAALGIALAIVSGACNKSAPQGGSPSGSTKAGVAVNKQAQYDVSRLAAELKANSPERRTKAIQMAMEFDGQGEDVIPTLLEALKDSTAGPLGKTSERPDSTRETAVQALLSLKGKGIKALQDSGLRTLENGLRNEKPNVREHTVNAIGMVGTDAKQSTESVAKLCADPEKEVRAAAYRALQKIKPPSANLILKLLMHRNVVVAMEAADALSWLKPSSPENVEPLLEAVKREARPKEEPSDITYIRNKAAEALSGIGKGAEPAVPTLVEMLTKIKEDDIGKMLLPSKGESSQLSGPILALRKIGKPAVPAIIPLLKHNEPIVRYSAAAVLSGMNKGDAAEALPKIQEALEAERTLPNGQMQIYEELIAATLNQGGDADKVVPGVIELLKSDDEVVRYRAAKMLARVGRKAEPAVPKLIELLNDPKSQIQAAAVEALTAIGPAAKDAVIALAKKVEGDDVQLARDAAKALREFGPIAGPAAPSLAKALDSPDSGLCLDAANALTAIGPEAVSAIDAIAKHLLDETARRDERIALLQATAAIGPPAKQAIPAVNTLLSRKEIPVQVAAAETLGRIGSGDPEALKKLGEVLKDTRNTPQAVQFAVLRAIASMGAKGGTAVADVKAYQDQAKDTSAKVWASATLVALGSDADANAKVVLAALKDTAPTAKTARVAAIESAEYLGARAKPGVTDLIEALKDKSSIGRTDGGTVREKAALILGKLGPNAKEAIRPLTDLLKDSDRGARRAAAEALGYFGPDAVVAAPKLRELARTDAELASVANAALDKIESMKKTE